MSDIVDRLRACNGKVIVGPFDWLNEAADLIEQQAKEIAAMKVKDWDLENDALLRSLDKAQAEIKRLRGTLVNISVTAKGALD